MKTILQFKLFIAAILVVLAQVVSTAQSFNGSKTLNKTVKVTEDIKVQMNNYSGDLKIFTTGDNSVTIKTSIEVSGNSKDDVDKVIAAVEKFDFKLSGNTMRIDTRFYKNMSSTNNKITMILENGDKVKIKEFKISHELFMPKAASIDLNNKYSDIEMETLDGDASFVLYSSKLYAENFSGELNIESKYSKIYLENISENADFDFYDTDIEMESCKNLTINSKYSKYEIAKTGDLDIESYDDNFEIEKMASLKFTSKYSDFVSQADVNNIQLEIYDSSIEVNTAERVVFNGKYSNIKLGDVGNLKIDDSYDNNIFLGNTKKIEIGRSKYSVFEIKSISELKFDDVYQDNIKIEKLNTNFAGISMNGKYGKLQVDAGTVPFRIQFKIKYPKVDIPESVKISKQIKDSSDLELVGGESGGIISVEGYDMKVVIND